MFDMTTLCYPLKPLSVNKCWKGQKFKTDDYVQYEKDVSRLTVFDKPVTGKVQIDYRFYLKNDKLTDVDNLVKGLQDILVKKGLIEDDRYIRRITAEKFESNEDRIEVDIYPYEKTR